MVPVVVAASAKSRASKAMREPVLVAEAVDCRVNNDPGVVVGPKKESVVVARDAVLDARSTPRTWKGALTVEEAEETNPLLKCHTRLSVTDEEAV